MHRKIFSLLVIFTGLVSLPAFSQVQEKSTHPKMDKYYPPKQKPETENVTNTPQPVQTEVVPENTPAKPVAAAPVVTKVPNATVPAETKPVSNVPVAVVPPETNAISQTPPPQPVTDSVAVIKPATTNIPPAVPKKVVSAQPSTPYRPTRLGSSSTLYRTWETNNDGAGSVTTGSK